jgi:hypothetical protein|tara:strand:+ start:366 stop:713 length:348 start_codon:yes stop_codon:yes gene_type:complete
MKQHNSFKNDMDLISEAAMGVLGGAHMMHNVAGNAADALAQDDGYNSPEEAAEDSSKKDILSNLDQAIAQVDGIDEIDGLADALANVIDHYGQKHEDGEHHGAPTPVSPEDEAYM